MVIALIEIFCPYDANKMKRTFITTLQCNILYFLVNRVSEPLVRCKMAITSELKLSNFSRGIKRLKDGYQVQILL